MLKTLLLLIAASPAFAISLTTFNISWNVLEIASGEVLCSGEVHTPFVGTVCADVVPTLDGIQIMASGGASDGPGFAVTEAHAQGNIGGNIDPSLFSIELDIDVIAFASNISIVTGGSGGGLFNGVVHFSGASDGTSFFEADALLGDFFCQQFCQDFIPFTFNEPFDVLARSRAGLHRTTTGSTNAEAEGFATAGQLLDLDRNHLPGAQLQLVPEAHTGMLLSLGLAVLIGFRRFKAAS